MATKLTEKAIAAMQAPTANGKQALHWCNQLRGFGVLLSGVSNSKTFVVQRKINGKTRRVTIGACNVLSLKEAQARAEKVLADFYAGRDPKAKPAGMMTLREAYESYVASPRLRTTSKMDYEWIPRHLSNWLDLPLRDITPDMVEKKHASMQSEIAARSKGRYRGEVAANAVMTTLRAIWNDAALKSPMPPNPVSRLKRMWFPQQRRTRIVHPDDMPKFYAAICALPNAVLRDYVFLLMFTGMRRKEAASLTWDDIDFSLRIITVSGERTKSRKALIIPMTTFVYDLLVARRQLGRDRFVFPSSSKSGHVESPDAALRPVAAACGVRVSAHDLRRGYITVAESCDISFIALKALVGHTHRDVTSGYTQIMVERLRQPAQRVCDELMRMCGIGAVDANSKVRRLRK
jgi:integrase